MYMLWKYSYFPRRFVSLLHKSVFHQRQHEAWLASAPTSASPRVTFQTLPNACIYKHSETMGKKKMPTINFYENPRNRAAHTPRTSTFGTYPGLVWGKFRIRLGHLFAPNYQSKRNSIFQKRSVVCAPDILVMMDTRWTRPCIMWYIHT